MATYVNGSDMLLYIGSKAFGSCTSHSTEFASETKQRAVKPLASAGKSAGLWKQSGITGLSIKITGSGLVAGDETESSFGELLTAWKAGTPVTVKCMERGKETPYLEGSFIISNLKREDPANEDATYEISLENNGEPTTLDASVLAPAPIL